MQRRERLMATMRGQAVDRPAVSFYELNGYDEKTEPGDPFNIYCDPSWAPLLDLTREKTDRILLREVPLREQGESSGERTEKLVGVPTNPLDALARTETFTGEKGARMTRMTIEAPGRTLTSLTRRDRDVNTVWTVEHLLKDAEDLAALLEMPMPGFRGEPDVAGVLETEAALGDTGIVMIDTADPLCLAAGLFDMGTFTILAMTEPTLFHALLERFAAVLQPKTEAVAAALPGRLWRIFGPEYATPPYLPPALFRDYVVRYDTPMVQAIQRHGGFARIHSHGNVRQVLDDIASTGAVGLDPIEPPPQGDVELREVRERYGRQIVLFGNLEVSDIENLPTVEFEKKVRQALEEGTAGEGRGFVLMPSSAPYGRVLPDLTLRNYEKIIEMVEDL